MSPRSLARDMAATITVALWTIVRKEVHRFLRLWVQTLVPPVITMGLYFAIFGNLIGSRIGQMGGYDYMEFIVPGLVMMAVINSSYSNVVSSFFNTKFNHFIEEILVAPTPLWVLLTGYLLGGILRGLGVGLVVVVVSLLFTSLHINSVGLSLLVILLTATIFSLGGFINALFANSFDSISILPNFVLTPLTYLGGVFYSIDLLPQFFRSLSLINPILYLVNAFRYALLGSSDVAVGTALAAAAIFAAALYLFTLWLLYRGVGIRN